jgi:AraC family transcriptional regulator
MNSYQEQEYIARINRAIDYIQTNLHAPLSLTAIAKVANFSPFHFHRIFGTQMGETLNGFIQRIRIEKAASMLVANPKKSITEIAFDCGFSGSASFARLFRNSYGMSASDWRSGGYLSFNKVSKKKSKNCKTISNNWKEQNSSSGYILNGKDDGGANRSVENLQSKHRSGSMSVKNTKVEVKEIPAMTVAYVRHIGPYKGNANLFANLWSKLMAWAGPRDLVSQPGVKMLCMYHDDPEITDENSLRLSVCITIPKETKTEGEIGKMDIAAGKYAVGHFELNENEFESAWNYLYGEWLPKSGYQPDDGACYEQCLNDPKEHPEHKYIVDIHVPIKPL